MDGGLDWGIPKEVTSLVIGMPAREGGGEGRGIPWMSADDLAGLISWPVAWLYVERAFRRVSKAWGVKSSKWI